MRLFLLIVCLLVFVGCHSQGKRLPRPSDLLAAPRVDTVAQTEADTQGNPKQWAEATEAMRASRTSKETKRKSVLCLSGGGSHGAFTAGVLNGWTHAGNRPEFDVVTGVSTGALIAPLAFLGPDYDATIRDFYTGVMRQDIFQYSASQALWGQSFADHAPLGLKIRSLLTKEFVEKLAKEHAKGRRLYLGTTDLDRHQFVVWDIGHIASQGTPDSRELIAKIMLGSAAIPGMFPPSKIRVTVDGQVSEERHGDGSVSQALFFRPPYVPPTEKAADVLSKTDVYVIIAGKLYGDPADTTASPFGLAESSFNAMVSNQFRGDLNRVYLTAVATGMNYRVCSMPTQFPALPSRISFDKNEMTAMYNEGVRHAKSPQAWNTTPPDADERTSVRQGTTLNQTKP